MNYENAKCLDCKWWKMENDKKEHTYGACTHSPPSQMVMMNGVNKWKQPLTHKEDKCSLFESQTGEAID